MITAASSVIVDSLARDGEPALTQVRSSKTFFFRRQFYLPAFALIDVYNNSITSEGEVHMRRNAVLVVDEIIELSAGVREVDGFKGVYAKRAIKQDSVIFHLRGSISSSPSKYTIQLGSNRHLNLPADRKPNDDYCWQYLNHQCEPNGYINTSARTLRALRDIAAGEEITFNYLTTEWEMAVPFNCICGSPNCFGFIQGSKFLTAAEADRLALVCGDTNVVTLFMPIVRKAPKAVKISRPR